MTGRAFTAVDLARVADLRVEETEQFLADFAEQGLVRRAAESGYEATRAGLELSRALSLATPDPAERSR